MVEKGISQIAIPFSIIKGRVIFIRIYQPVEKATPIPESPIP